MLNYNSCVVCLCARTHAALGVWRRERVLMFQKVSTSITLKDSGGPLLFVLTVKYQSKLHLKETKKLTATYQQCDHGLLETPAAAISTNLIRSKNCSHFFFIEEVHGESNRLLPWNSPLPPLLVSSTPEAPSPL